MSFLDRIEGNDLASRGMSGHRPLAFFEHAGSKSNSDQKSAGEGALSPEETSQLDAMQAHILQLVSTLTIPVSSATMALKLTAPNGHDHAFVPGALRTQMARLVELEHGMEGITARLGMLRTAPWYRCLLIAHGLDVLIHRIPVLQLQQVLGNPSPEATPDPEFDRNGLMHFPGPASLDEITVL